MLEELQTRLANSSQEPLSLPELEDLYTTGCAQVLELEAEAMRIGRQRASIDERLMALREDLRHVRTAIEWLREQPDASGLG